MMTTDPGVLNGVPIHPQPKQSRPSLTCRKPAAACCNGHNQAPPPDHQLHPTRDNHGCLILTPHNQLSGILPVEWVDKDNGVAITSPHVRLDRMSQ